MSAILDVSNALKYPGQVYTFEVEPEVGDMEVLSDPVHYEHVFAKGEFFCTGEKISIQGDVTSTVTSRCARCLEPVTLEIDAEIDAQFARSADPEDPDLYCFEGSKLDLTDAVRDALLLNLPYRFVCSEDCRGLCPQCGVNLNLGTCTCQEGEEVTNPFSALKAIVQNNEEV